MNSADIPHHTNPHHPATPAAGTRGLGAIILAGGKGERLQPDKGCLLVGGKPIVARVAEAAQAVAERVIIVGSAPLPAGFAVPVIPDEGSEPGPVGGLATGLAALGLPHAFLLAWDMPFVAPELLKHMATLIVGHEAVVPRVAGRPQPLCALYCRDCLSALTNLPPARNKRGPSMTYVLEQLKVRWVDEAELAAFGDPELLFFNVNTPEDLARAQDMV